MSAALDHNSNGFPPQVTALRRQIRAMGYAPVPTCGKAVYLPQWREAAARADEAEFQRWETVFIDADPLDGSTKTYRGDRHTNTGVSCDGLACPNIDILDTEIAKQVEAAARGILGPTPLRRVGQAPKSLLVYRAAAPIEKLKTAPLLLPNQARGKVAVEIGPDGLPAVLPDGTRDGAKAEVEILASGQQFVGYGIHPDTGTEYTWTDLAPDVVPATELPAVTAEALGEFLAEAERIIRHAGGRTAKEWRALAENAKPAAPPRPKLRAVPNNTGNGDTAYGLAALEAERSAILSAGFGNQETTVNNAALKIGGLVAGGELDEGPALTALLAAARSVPSQPGKKAWAPAELERKVRRAFEAGKHSPRQAPEKVGPVPVWSREERQAPPMEDGSTKSEPHALPDDQSGGPMDVDPAGVELTQDGVAWAFAAAVRGKFVFDHTSQQWFRWGDGRWSLDAKAGAFHAVRRYCHALRSKAADAPRSMAGIGFISNVERAARTDPRVAVSHEDWDRDRWLLGVPGGVVDLRTGKMRPGEPGLYIRRQTAVAPAAPGAVAPLWQAFLDGATQGDKHLQGFLQRFAGYLLTGDVTEEVLTFLYGPGGNGKGVFLGAVTAILADYAVAVPIEVFTANSRLNLEGSFRVSGCWETEERLVGLKDL